MKRIWRKLVQSAMLKGNPLNSEASLTFLQGSNRRQSLLTPWLLKPEMEWKQIRLKTINASQPMAANSAKEKLESQMDSVVVCARKLLFSQEMSSTETDKPRPRTVQQCSSPKAAKRPTSLRPQHSEQCRLP